MNMRFIISAVIIVAILGIWYWASKSHVAQTQAPQTQTADYKNAAYTIEGQSVTLVNGSSTVPAAPGSASNIVTQYFGNEATGDLNGDGVPDVAFILTQNSGGSGTFYYIVAAIKTPDGYQGTNGILLGDRIAPQTTQIEDGQVVVNYADRSPSEPMSAEPSIGVSKYLQIANGMLAEIPANEYAAGNLLLGTDASAKLGTYLIGSNGMTLYAYDKDASSTSNCTGACAAAWPPYLVGTTSVLANVQSGVSGTVGTLTRGDGTKQMTYNGAPLYYYKSDTKSGDMKGQGVANQWKVVHP
ncbi:MAG: hypothetical protein WAN50_04980 [Minisyncoccia bacterium]